MLSDRLEESIQVFVDFFAQQMGDNLGTVEVFLLDRETTEHKSINNVIPNVYPPMFARPEPLRT